MGSLFKLRDHWYSRYSSEEFSHVKALALGNADNEVNGETKIILGSFTGTLRILQPVKKGMLQPEDTLVEKEFGEPILQVACRPLESVGDGPPRNLVAVLLSRRLVLLRMLRVGGATLSAERGTESTLSTSYHLEVYYEASLDRSSYNFTFGRFGYTSHEMVCVQSLDGMLTVVDHNRITLRCFLPTTQFVLPGCLTYSSHRDCFLTNNSAMVLVCYPFSTLSSTAGRETAQIDTDDEHVVSHSRGELVTPAWTYVLGEDAVGIEVCRHTEGLCEDDADIVVLCQYTLFVLQLNGELRYLKRLDVESLCVTSYYIPSVNRSNVLIGTITGLVQVHSATSLEWSAKMTTGAPLCLEVAELMHIKGLIVSLSTDGTLAANYLGTNPEDEPIQPLESRESDYNEMEQELRRVQHAIKQMSNAAVPPETAKDSANENDSEEQLHVRWEDLSSEMVGEDGTKTVTLTLRNDIGADISGEVTVFVHVVQPVKVTEQQKVLPDGIPLGAEVQVPFCFTALEDKDLIMPSSLDARAVVMYTNSMDVRHTVNTTVRLPFTLVARPISPLKNTEFVLQLNTEEEGPPSLLNLFPDVARSAYATANVVTFQYVNGADATILVSRNASRFRLQGSTMEALWLLTDELQRRLYTYYGMDVQLSIPDPISLENYYGVIDTHVEVRKEMLEAQRELSRAAQMFRAVQKRLLVLFREGSPTPVGMMDVLFEEVYGRIQRCIDNVCRVITRQRQAAAMLCCCSRLVVLQLLIKCSNTLKNPDEIRMLESIFTCSISSESESGWEEVTDAALSFLLFGSKAVPSPASSPAAASAQPSSDAAFSMNLDVRRLKKCIGILFDRLLSGQPLTSS